MSLPGQSSIEMGTMEEGTEAGIGTEPSGYHRLAAIMQQDESLAIFRRFQDINMLLLMSLQAEILDLQFWLRHRSSEDESTDSPLPRVFRELRLSHQRLDASRPRSTPSSETNIHLQTEDVSLLSQYQLLLRLRERMSEYNNLLLQVSQLAQLPKPHKSQLNEVKQWLRADDGGADFLKGTEFFTWEEDDVNKYVVLKNTSIEEDFLTKSVISILRILHRLVGYRWKLGRIIDKPSGLTSISDTKISRVSSMFAAALSSALPVLAIFVLNSLQSTTLRLGVTVVFTSIFAIVLASISSARKVEIFTATAAFAAVEVVFIGTTINKP
ncbi:hypothetical protein GGS20DRAFT_586496 [Poronia punctata]|nr:hypothetical protein GGS20DRAFT_586496 [Poronia punctata]